jgi:hypothetical protein
MFKRIKKHYSFVKDTGVAMDRRIYSQKRKPFTYKVDRQEILERIEKRLFRQQ